MLKLATLAAVCSLWVAWPPKSAPLPEPLSIMSLHEQDGAILRPLLRDC
jgi:hypothetical protein